MFHSRPRMEIDRKQGRERRPRRGRRAGEIVTLTGTHGRQMIALTATIQKCCKDGFVLQLDRKTRNFLRSTVGKKINATVYVRSLDFEALLAAS